MPIKILIVGKNSYIGNATENWLNRFNGKYNIEKLSVRNAEWKTKDFSCYDVIIYVSAIVHRKEKPNLKDLYYKVNCETVINIAAKAKSEGVKQFIFMSSMSVYGMEQGVINKNTVPNPNSLYGKSKLSAEKELSKLDSEKFKIVIIRPPMVYGKLCTGNYAKLSKFARTTPIFIKTQNMRSMVYIDNLSEFVKLMIDNDERGVFFPQNAVYVNTSDMVALISEIHRNKCRFVTIPNSILNVLFKFKVFNKMFGSLVYEYSSSEYRENYQIIDFKRSIQMTEA